MNCKYTIKNFRVFDEEGATFDLRPITILTGCNSSGKSSLSKSILVIDRFFKRINEMNTSVGCIQLNNLYIDFNEYPINLGGFSTVLNNTPHKKKGITFSLELYSVLLHENIFIELTFQNKDNDIFDRGWLTKLSIKNSFEENVLSFNVKKNNVLDLQVKFDYFLSKLKLYLSRKYNYWSLYIDEHESLDNEDAFNSDFQLLDNYIHSDKILSDNLYDLNNEDSHRYKEYVEFYLPERMCFYVSNFNVLKYTKEKALSLIRAVNSDKIDPYSKYVEELLSGFEQSEDNDLLSYLRRIQELYMLSKSICSIKLEHDVSLISLIRQAIDINSSDNIRQISKIDDIGLNNKKHQSNKLYRSKIEETFRGLSMILHKIKNEKENSDLYECGCFNLWYELVDFICRVVKDTIIIDISGNMSYLSSTNIDLSRIYISDGNQSTFRNLIAKYHTECLTKIGPETVGCFIDKWLKKLEIGHHFVCANIEGGLGIVCKIMKSQDDTKGRLIADFGFGYCQLLSILIQIELIIMHKENLWCSSIIGRGILHSPEVAMFERRRIENSNTIIIEEPEAHLHPKFQSYLADILLDAYSHFNINFIVETHSEYMIRRSQVIVASQKNPDMETLETKNPFVVYYFEQDGKCRKIRYGTKGVFLDKFGKGFYDEASDLTFQILRLGQHD